MLTQEIVTEMFDYRADGELLHKNRIKARTKVGDVCGSVAADGRSKEIRIYYKLYRCHRIIWLWHYGYMPKYIDHINGNGLDNRIENLREATLGENSRNNRSKNWKIPGKYKGVTPITNTKGEIRYRVAIVKDGVTVSAPGVLLCPRDAATVYNFKAYRLHKEFAVYNDDPLNEGGVNWL
jgi:hypothetical protein